MSGPEPHPLVTVLVDTYNHERFIDDAIRSVLDQDFDMSRVEIIVVDDGSTDATPAKLAAYGSRINVVRKANGGQASAFNTGIPLARGEIIAFLDGDDWWAREKLREVVAAFEQHPNASAVGHGIIFSNENGSQVPQSPGADVVFTLRDLDGAREFPRRACYFGTSRLAARTGAVNKLLPAPERLIVEADEYFFTLLPALSEVVLLAKPLCHYRIHGGNLFQFSANDEKRIRTKMQVMNCLAEVLPGKLRELGVPGSCADAALRTTMLDARRLKLAVEGGPPGSALPVEMGYWRENPGWSLKGLPVKLLMMLLAVLLPAKTFYKVRAAYTRFREVPQS